MSQQLLAQESSRQSFDKKKSTKDLTVPACGGIAKIITKDELNDTFCIGWRSKKKAFAQQRALKELKFLQSTQIVLSIPKYN